jgi:hypothetical protein
MFLHFHGIYNMILFVFKIIDHMQIKTLTLFFIFFIFFNIYKTYIKKYEKHTRTSLFTMLNSHFTFTCYNITKIPNKSNKIQKLQNRTCLLSDSAKINRRLFSANNQPRDVPK